MPRDGSWPRHSETQTLLDGLVESLPTACILLLGTYRPEYQHGWGAKTYYTQLRLDPLPPASADALSISAAPTTTWATIVGRSSA
jgi:hypothetical protein